MSIRPIDILGQTLRTQDISTIKANEDARPVAQQSVLEQDELKHDMRQAESVNEKDNAGRQEFMFDAKDKGRNEYQDNRKKKDSKNKQEDRVIKKDPKGGFDISI